MAKVSEKHRELAPTHTCALAAAAHLYPATRTPGKVWVVRQQRTGQKRHRAAARCIISLSLSLCARSAWKKKGELLRRPRGQRLSLSTALYEYKVDKDIARELRLERVFFLERRGRGETKSARIAGHLTRCCGGAGSAWYMSIYFNEEER